ncbi:hypothetical protein BT93_C1930 [Corymbia citriodora subsp. variegata]|nr:hypothetical protein BT93_C1930 [Corymbia citriodora subsp. variegata]
MLGGVAMWSAATKVAGVVGVLRGASAVLQSVRSASRFGRVSTIVSVNGSEVAAGDVPQATAQMPVGEPMARIVFGEMSYEEVKGKAAEWKDVIDKLYLSSTNITECEDQLPADQACGLLLPLLANSGETRSSVISEALATYPGPEDVVQAFRLLSQSPAAQTFVDSVANDPNVWDALMNNEALIDFVQSQNYGIQFPEPQGEISADDALSDDWKLPRKAGENSEGGHENGFMSILQKIKQMAKEKFSNIFANTFSIPSAEKTSSDTSGNAGPAPRASYMALLWALLTIIVFLARRC